MIQVLAILTPVVLLVALGALLMQFGFYGDGFRRGLDRLVYWVAVPALVTDKLGRQTSFDPDAGHLILALFVATLGSIGVGYLIAWAIRLPGPTRASLVQAGFRGNLAFLALPVVLLSVADGGFESDAVEAQAVLLLAPMMLFYNVAAVFVLELGRTEISFRMLPTVARSIGTNPIILSCLVGIAIGASGFEMPEPIDETLVLLGATAAPLALLSLGGTLVVYEVKSNLVRATIAALVKVAIVPLFAWIAGRALNLDGQAMLVLMVYASAPTAVASYVMASQLGADEALAASALVMSTLLSAGSLGVALSWAV